MDRKDQQRRGMISGLMGVLAGTGFMGAFDAYEQSKAERGYKKAKKARQVKRRTELGVKFNEAVAESMKAASLQTDKEKRKAQERYTRSIIRMAQAVQRGLIHEIVAAQAVRDCTVEEVMDQVLGPKPLVGRFTGSERPSVKITAPSASVNPHEAKERSRKRIRAQRKYAALRNPDRWFLKAVARKKHVDVIEVIFLGGRKKFGKAKAVVAGGHFGRGSFVKTVKRQQMNKVQALHEANRLARLLEALA